MFRGNGLGELTKNVCFDGLVSLLFHAAVVYGALKEGEVCTHQFCFVSHVFLISIFAGIF
jgi:hypothetical protein